MTSIARLNSSAESSPRRVCFSFAAYAKTVIDHLKKCNIAIARGLSGDEFSYIESSFGFTFPPDLRSILREGLPLGPGFPNWRSSSPQQLEILINLPIRGLQKEVTKNRFWCPSWGDEPSIPKEALTIASSFMKKAPLLVPIYRNYYIPSVPNLAGNPIFYVRDADVHYSGYDVAGFFQNVEFRQRSSSLKSMDSPRSTKMGTPSWAAKAARRIEFWSDLVDSGAGGIWRRRKEAVKLNGYFEDLGRILKQGGWREEEVRDMMSNPMDGQDHEEKRRTFLGDTGNNLTMHVRLLSLTLLRAGWSTDDVAYCLGCKLPQQQRGGLLPDAPTAASPSSSSNDGSAQY